MEISRNTRRCGWIEVRNRACRLIARSEALAHVLRDALPAMKEMAAMNSDPRPHKPQRGLYALILVGAVIVAGAAAWSFSNGGLPGTRDTPSTTVNGQPTVGRTAAD